MLATRTFQVRNYGSGNFRKICDKGKTFLAALRSNFSAQLLPVEIIRVASFAFVSLQALFYFFSRFLFVTSSFAAVQEPKQTPSPARCRRAGSRSHFLWRAMTSAICPEKATRLRPLGSARLSRPRQLSEAHTFLFPVPSFRPTSSFFCCCHVW